jgi:cysteine desulfuration protein SufE
MLQPFDDLCADFALLDTPDERYQHVLDLGRQLPAMPEQFCHDNNLVQGCMSRVWLHYMPASATQVAHFLAQSDAIVVRGLLYVLLSAGQTCNDWAQFSSAQVLQAIGLQGFLSTQRAGGLAAAANKMRDYALRGG